MNIIVFNNGYESGVLSGGDRHLLAVAKELGAPVTGVDWRQLPLGGVGKVSLVFRYLWRILTALIKMPDGDVVLCGCGFVDLVPAMVHKFLYGSRVLTYVWHVSGREFLAKILWRYCDGVFVSNAETLYRLHGLGVWETYYTKPVVDADAVVQAEPLLMFDVLYVGRLKRSKGCFDVLDIAEKMPGVSFGMVGSGPEYLKLEREITRRGLNVRIVTGASDNLVKSLIKGCKVYLNPSYEEGYSITTREAMIALKPCVARDLPVYSRLGGTDSYHNMLYLFTNLSGAVDSIRKALESSKDCFKYAEISKRIRSEVWDAKAAVRNELSFINIFG